LGTWSVCVCGGGVGNLEEEGLEVGLFVEVGKCGVVFENATVRAVS